MAKRKTRKAKESKGPQTQECVLGDVADSQPTSLTKSNPSKDDMVLDCQGKNENVGTLPSQPQSYSADQEPSQSMISQQDIIKDDSIVNNCPNVVPQSVDEVFPSNGEPSTAQSLSPPSEVNNLVTRPQVQSLLGHSEADFPGDSSTEKTAENDEQFEDLPEVVLSQPSSFPSKRHTFIDTSQNDVSKACLIQKDALSSQNKPSPPEVVMNAQEESQHNCPLHESFKADITPSDSSLCSTNNNNKQIHVTSPVIKQRSITPRHTRPKTPDNPILPMSIDDIFSPNTKTSIKSTIHELFPELVPQPVIPVKKRKKGEPYIVGCTERRKVPEKRTLNVFKGDDYGITSKTNAIDNEKPKKRRRPTKQYPNWSKSKFNPKSDEIAARLRLNEKVDELLRKSPSKETASFMTKPYSSRPQAFSPLPSTSKDNETIMKNEKHFNDSLNCDNNTYEIADDEELPEVIIDTDKEKKKKHVSLLRKKDLEILNKNVPIVINEDLNNNNDIEFEEFDFTKIKIKKCTPETIVKRSNSPDNCNEQLKPSQTDNKTATIIDTIEINDDHEDRIGSLSNVTPVIEVDNLFGHCSASKENTLKVNEASQNQQIPATSSNTESASVIELPDIVEPALSNRSSINRVNPKYFWNEDVEFISETPPKPGTVSNDLKPLWCDSEKTTARPLNNEIENVVNGFFSGQSSTYNNRDRADEVLSDVMNDFQMVFSILTDSFSGYRKTKRRKRKHPSNTNNKTPNKSSAPKDQAPEAPVVNNENADPSANAQTTPMNGQRSLGDCPICMENLSKNLIASTTCGHVFCLECIKTCLRTSGKRCPTCRKMLKGVGYHQVFL